jgi:DNA-binding CsgD family transcriptional regulator
MYRTSGPDGERSSESVPHVSPEFQALARRLPAYLYFLPPTAATSATFEQLTLPLRAGSPRAVRTHRTLPNQSRPLLDLEQRQQELVRVAAGESYRQIARDYGVSYGAIYRLVRTTRTRADQQEGIR